MKEEWKVIENTNGDYMVSNYGNIKSRRCKGWRTFAPVIGEWENVTPVISNVGYSYVTIRYNNSIKRQKSNVHRLVAHYFLPKNSNEKYLEVNHIDSDRLNNRVDNLEWVTSSGNTEHAVRKGRLVPWNNPRKAIISINLITGEEKYFESISKAEEYYNTRHIVDVLKGRRSSTKGHYYRYAEEGDAL